MSESFADLFEESLKASETRVGEVVTAEVVRIEHNFVVVNAGLKSEAYVPLSEFKSDKGELEVEVGAFVSVAIVAMLRKDIAIASTSSRGLSFGALNAPSSIRTIECPASVSTRAAAAPPAPVPTMTNSAWS